MNGNGNAYQINIKVTNQNGRFHFTYEPSVLRACPGDSVTWVSPHGPFAIEFKHDTPTNQMSAHGDPMAGSWRSGQMVIRPDARGHYHYAVAVSLSGEVFGPELDRRVVLDAACPEIIVN